MLVGSSRGLEGNGVANGGHDEPGAVWRSGWVDMAMTRVVMIAPLVARRVLRIGRTPEVVQR